MKLRFVLSATLAGLSCLYLGVSPRLVSAQGGQIPQGHQTQYWPTANADAQRDSWVRLDPHISVLTMRQKNAGFGLVRKAQMEKTPATGLSSSQVTFESAAGGYKSMGFVVDAAGNAVGFDSDTSQVFWKTPLGAASGSAKCASQPNVSLTRLQKGWVPRIPIYPEIEGGYAYGIEAGFRTRDHQPPASGTLGEPHKGAVNIDEANQPVLPAGAARPDAAERAAYNAAPGGAFALAADGMLHQLSLLKGYDTLTAPVRFLPSNAKAAGLIGIDDRLYAATVGQCGGTPDGVWSISVSAQDKSVTSWTPKGTAIAGTAGPAFGVDGTVFVATGESSSADPGNAASVVSLDPKTLKMKDYFSAGQSGFVSAPVVIHHNGRDLVAALNRDGKLYLLDGALPGGGDHKTPLSVSAKLANFGADYTSGALASWQSPDGMNWVLVPIGASVAADAAFSGASSLTKGAVLAFKIVDRGVAPSLQPGWASPNMAAPLPPMIINGVVFAAAGGGTGPAILYAFEGTSGEQLWSSGSSITSPARLGGLSTIYSTVYLTTADDTLWAFGFPQDKQ